jgi:hypothetical protein
MYTLVIRSDLNTNIARVPVLGFAQHEGKRRVGIPVGCSPPTKVAIAVDDGAEDAHEIFGVGEESFHPQALARARRHQTSLHRHRREP